MAFLQCDCGFMLKGLQHSRKVMPDGEYRLVEYKVGAAMDMGEWQEIDNEHSWMRTKEVGVYCPSCCSPVVLAPEESSILIDKRIPGVGSGEFRSGEVVESLEKLSEKERADIYIHQMPDSEASFGTLNEELPVSLKEALNRMGINDLYVHQADTYNSVRKGKDVVLVTHTASGKTLSYNLPILQGLLEDESARALYIFPTKALADDQVEQLYRWTELKDTGSEDEDLDDWYERSIKLGEKYLSFGRFDGDTQLGSRRRLLKDGRILFTNPDMIHHSILKNAGINNSSSQDTISLLKNLKYIVIDEMHLYRGAFGSHVSLVLKRLQKICENLGNTSIQFILCSATIDQPDRLAELLTGRNEFQLVDNDGSIKRKRNIIFWNPGLTLDTGERKAPVSDALSIAENVLVQKNRLIRTIMFQGSRLQGKVTARSMKDVLRKKLRLKKDDVSGVKLSAFYNGMLAVEERKQVIHAIKKNDVHMVIATNALEVGIDIGDLSVAILSGYPGSKAAFSQQIGRVGRKGEGVAVMIFEDEPLQQYYMQNPDKFLEKPPEVVRIDPRNRELLKLHLQYLQEELGRKLIKEDLNLFDIHEDYQSAILAHLSELTTEELSERCSLRSGSGTSYKVVSTKNREVLIDNVDEWTALRDFHEGAVYWNANEKGYKVDSFNSNRAEILVKPIAGEIEYYTQSIYKDTISISEQTSDNSIGHVKLMYGELNIKRSVFAYNKSYFNSRVTEIEPLLTPISSNFDSEGCWIHLSKESIGSLSDLLGEEATQEKLEGSLRAAEHVILSVIPDTIICDSRDISSFSGFSLPNFDGNPVIGFYGNESGGMGITTAIGENLNRIIESALNLLKTCSCPGGCPSCIQYPGKNNEHLSKAGGRFILSQIAASYDVQVEEAEMQCR
ncbi:DEAD/DEAH box helicase [Rossellomorea vietnamensis]|uniref:DEAD/DEAH box helicase n=1 Tax=Rossellomorea vietnamensis TaxID=218284 RepID=A0A5D4K6V1_9BACI|nr:DEAD/DEAH box helicase [Rossellomorea vietnamensis]TYR73137.1 DEAD/DEAH box helicase [Rossellomorea vietnamensis]